MPRDTNKKDDWMKQRRLILPTYGKKNHPKIYEQYPEAVIEIIKNYKKENCNNCRKSTFWEGECKMSYKQILFCMVVKEEKTKEIKNHEEKRTRTESEELLDKQDNRIPEKAPSDILQP